MHYKETTDVQVIPTHLGTDLAVVQNQEEGAEGGLLMIFAQEEEEEIWKETSI